MKCERKAGRERKREREREKERKKERKRERERERERERACVFVFVCVHVFDFFFISQVTHTPAAIAWPRAAHGRGSAASRAESVRTFP